MRDEGTLSGLLTGYQVVMDRDRKDVIVRCLRHSEGYGLLRGRGGRETEIEGVCACVKRESEEKLM